MPSRAEGPVIRPLEPFALLLAPPAPPAPRRALLDERGRVVYAR